MAISYKKVSNFHSMNSQEILISDLLNQGKKQIQTGKKKGWCYIGSYRDYRSCLKVGKDDTCVSDEIFPTKEQCENPNLR